MYVADKSELDGFILTIGVVSNHGNWFTADDLNKELLVLKQSYDWLHIKRIEAQWFNVLSPNNTDVHELKLQLKTLSQKL